MRCEDVESLLSDLLDGTLAPTESARVSAHLVGCEACQVERDELQTVLTMLHAVPAETMPAGLFDRISAALAVEPAPAGYAMECDEALDLLSERREGTLDADEAPRLDDHLADCAACRQALTQLDAVVALLRRVEPLPLPAGLAGRIHDALAAPAIGCDEASDYMGSDADDWEAASLASHLEACAPCRHTQAELTAVVALLHRVEPLPVPTDLLTRITASLAVEPGEATGVVVPFAPRGPQAIARWPHWASSLVGAAAACVVFFGIQYLPGVGVPRIETAAVSVKQDVAVNIGFDADQSLNGVIFQVDLPDGLQFIDDKAQPMLAQSVSWKGSLEKGKTVVPIVVRGVRPGRYAIEAFVRKGAMMRKTTILLPVQG